MILLPCLGRAIGCYLPSGICTVPSGTVKLVLREKTFRSVLVQVPLGPASEVCGVFSDRDILPSLGQPRTKGITCNVLGVSLDNSDQSSKEVGPGC